MGACAQVVGLLSGWHAGLVMASSGGLLHAKRICQAAGVRVALSVSGGGCGMYCI